MQRIYIGFIIIIAAEMAVGLMILKWLRRDKSEDATRDGEDR